MKNGLTANMISGFTAIVMVAGVLAGHAINRILDKAGARQGSERVAMAAKFLGTKPDFDGRPPAFANLRSPEELAADESQIPAVHGAT